MRWFVLCLLMLPNLAASKATTVDEAIAVFAKIADCMIVIDHLKDPDFFNLSPVQDWRLILNDKANKNLFPDEKLNLLEAKVDNYVRISFGATDYATAFKKIMTSANEYDQLLIDNKKEALARVAFDKIDKIVSANQFAVYFEECTDRINNLN